MHGTRENAPGHAGGATRKKEMSESLNDVDFR